MRNLTPAEAARLTGVTNVQQRDWRRRGFTEGRAEGHNSFGPSELSELFLLGVFSGVGRISDGARLVPMLAPILGRYVEAVARDEQISEPSNVAVLWANGDVGSYENVETAFKQGTDIQQSGPVIVIDLSVIATPWAIKVRDYLGA